MKLIFAALGAATLFSMPAAYAAPTDYVATEPVDGATYGVGFDLRTRRVYNNGGGCVTVDTNATYTGARGDHGDHIFVSTSNANFLLQSNTDLGASVSAFGASLGGKLSMLDKEASSTYQVTLFAVARDWQPVVYLQPSGIKLIPEAVELLREGKVSEFRQRCGQGFVAGLQNGREYIGRAVATTSSLEAWQRWSAALDLDGTIYGVDIAGSATLGEEMETAFGASNLEIKTWATNSPGQNPTTIDQMLAAYSNFSTQTDPSVMVKMYVAPYTLAANYPHEVDSPFVLPSAETVLINAIWDYTALINDADFILKNEAQFAMGISPTVRRETRRSVKAERDAWTRTRDALLAKARECLESGGPCQTGGADVDDVLEQGLRLPRRYVSHCAGHRVEGKSLDSFMATASLGDKVKGDNEMDGGPVRFDIDMCTRERHDALFVRWTIQAREWKTRQKDGRTVRDTRRKRNTEFGFEREVPLLDVSSSSSANGLVALDGAEVYDCRFYVAPTAQRIRGSSCEGRIERETGEDPRGFQTLSASKGALRSIRCQADRQGDDNNLQCQGARHDRLDLRMFNIWDLRYEDNPRLPVLTQKKAALEEALKSARAIYEQVRNTPVAGVHLSIVRGFEQQLATIEELITDARADKRFVDAFYDARSPQSLTRTKRHRTARKIRPRVQWRPLARPSR